MATDATFDIVRLGSAGDGVAEAPAGPLYVPGALPGERIEVADGLVRRLASPVSPQRRLAPLCPHVERCGGCAVQHMNDEPYRAWKQALLTEALRLHGLAGDVRPMLSVPLQSRRRAVLTAHRQGARITLGFHAPASKDVVDLTACAILRPRIVAALPQVRELAAMLLADKAETHVTIIETAAGLDVAFADARRTFTPVDRARITDIAGRARLARLTVAADPFVTFAAPVLSIAGAEVVPPPGAFVQAASEAEQAMVAIAVEAVGKAKRVADLFCGLGTFSLALARRARVLAIDSERPLVDALADASRKASGLKPIETRVRDLYRDPLSPAELDGVEAVVLDPPRAGAKTQAEALARARKVMTIVAVSCNPATLARDVRILVDAGYRLEHVTPVDQFLFTPHLEAVAVLKRPSKRA